MLAVMLKEVMITCVYSDKLRGKYHSEIMYIPTYCCAQIILHARNIGNTKLV